MKVSLWVSQTARDFWNAVRYSEPFPRKLRESILRSPFDLTVKEFAGLTVRGAADGEDKSVHFDKDRAKRDVSGEGDPKRTKKTKEKRPELKPDAQGGN
jgi:hypothetical protein